MPLKGSLILVTKSLERGFLRLPEGGCSRRPPDGVAFRSVPVSDLRAEPSAAGGWGPPRERADADIAEDVRHGYYDESVEKSSYGVDFDSEVS
ncbi:MAG: hypothetical protein CME26_05495 [Gemmatimonadetes bacterium]|nr:hypothetical protein [Gemmatimonadota bacterium]